MGSIVPGLGTIVGAGIGLIVGYLGAAATNAFYDNSVNRGNGDDMWGHMKDNLWQLSRCLLHCLVRGSD